MPLFTDSLQRQIDVPALPRRIISLCPSLTETLFALGLAHRVVGRTRFCIHPKEAVKGVSRVGGTKEINFDRLHALQPDLIIGSKEENTPEMVARLDQDYPVYVTDVETVEDAFAMITDLGKLTNTSDTAHTLRQQAIDGWRQIPQLAEPITVLYFIWDNPMMAVGAGTFIDAVLTDLGIHNLLADSPEKGRYPTLSAEDVIRLRPQHVFLSSEPYPFAEKHIARFQDMLPETSIWLVDGEMFSWYGARMLLASDYFQQFMENFLH